MKWTGLNDLRESYLKFFESKGHLRMNSFPLVPQGDNSILLINAGMTPLKKYFQGIEEPPCHRMTTCQKCIRTPDLENVGKTARHGTYFEIISKREVTQHFKVSTVSCGLTNIFKVRCTDTLLTGGNSLSGRLLCALEIRLHRCHTAVYKQERIIVYGDKGKAFES